MEYKIGMVLEHNGKRCSVENVETANGYTRLSLFYFASMVDYSEGFSKRVLEGGQYVEAIVTDTNKDEYKIIRTNVEE
ncbi:hypothetical protein [Anaerosporobacter sp.]